MKIEQHYFIGYCYLITPCFHYLKLNILFQGVQLLTWQYLLPLLKLEHIISQYTASVAVLVTIT